MRKVVILNDVAEDEDFFVVCEAKRPYVYLCMFCKYEDAVKWCNKYDYSVVSELEGVV